MIKSLGGHLKKLIIILSLLLSISMGQDYSLQFDGVDDWVEVGNNGSMSLSGEPFSIQVWYRTIGEMSSQSTTIFDHYTQPSWGQPTAWSLIIYDGDNIGKAGFWYRWDEAPNYEENTIYTDNRIDDGNWHHLAVERYSDGIVSLFVDGIKQSQEIQMSNNAIIDNSGNYGIGSGHHYRYQACEISEVILSKTNVFSDNFNPDINFSENEDTVGHWILDEGSGNIVYDHSGNENHGTIYGATWVEDILGCTDEGACNYNQDATADDGSCEYNDLCDECGGDNTSCEIISDIDGNSYGTVDIGSQTWTRQNLKVTHYNNGDLIGENNDIDGYWYYDDNSDIDDVYGVLYNWYAVDDDRGVCPENYHVPSDDEFTELTDYLGGESIAGGKMKEAGHEHWNIYSDTISAEATNESGFTGLPAGYRDPTGIFIAFQSNTGYWSSVSAGSNNAWYRALHEHQSNAWRHSPDKHYGFSVRCILGEPIYGCTDSGACNYNPEAIEDNGSCVTVDECGECGGSGYTDNCGVCDDDPENDCPYDCAGVPGGSAVEDCAGECGGSAILDECDICEGPGIPEGECDCNGNLLDECGLCGGGGIPEGVCDCSGNLMPEGNCDCNGNLLDECGVCGGPGLINWFFDSDGDGFGSSQSGIEIQCSNASLPIVWVTNNNDIDDNFYCISNELLTLYEDVDGDGLGCGLPMTVCVTENMYNNQVDNSDDLECDCITNDTDLCGICAGSNECVDCLDIEAFNYNLDATVNCSDCCIYKDNYPDWDIDIYLYQYSSSITAQLNNVVNPINFDIMGGENDILAAFVGEDIRGMSIGSIEIPIGDLSGQMSFQLLMYSNVANDEIIHFKYYDFEDDSILEFDETIEYEANLIIGDFLNPYQFIWNPFDLPSWSFNIADFQYNGSVTSKVYIDDLAVGSTSDLVGAFIDGEVRGVTNGLAIPPFLGGGFSFNIMIFSNEAGGETVEFQYYDSANNLVIELVETLEFMSDMVVGNAIEPFILTPINVLNPVALNIDLRSGWNWFSINTFSDDLSLNNILSPINGSGIYIKSQGVFADYYEGFGWWGDFD